MEFNRNHYFVVGLLLLVFGIQLRFVETYVLTPELTNILAEQAGHPIAAVNATAQSIFPLGQPLVPARKTLHPPQWLGWSLLSVGAVLVLHALSMPKPNSA